MTATLTVEVVLLAVADRRLQVLLTDRGARYPGRRSLPGGEVGRSETLEAAALRLIAGTPAHVEQLRTYAQPSRDRRERAVAVAYLGLVAGPHAVAPARASWAPVDEQDDPPLALDHAAILADGVERARSKLEYTSLAVALVDEPFGLADLRRVYEAVWGRPLDPGNFRRKVLSTPGFVEAVEGHAPPGPGGGRPARLYRHGGSRLLHPAMLRPGWRS